MKKPTTNKSSRHLKQIRNLYVNGLHGRILHLSAPKNKNREILLLYGEHGSLEQMFVLAEILNRYGAVTVPDLPGIGGMDSFFAIKSKPILDNYADYLASLLQLRYKRRRVTIVATGFSFVVVTRMLQKYPDQTKKVDKLVSLDGLLHRDDLALPRLTYWQQRTLARIGSGRLASRSVRNRCRVNRLLLTVDLRNDQIELNVHHVFDTQNTDVDRDALEQRMRVVYKDFKDLSVNKPAQASKISTNKDAMASFVTPALRRLLR